MKEKDFLNKPKCPYCSNTIDKMSKEESKITHYIENKKFNDIIYLDIKYTFHCDTCRIYISVGNESMKYIKE